jgi:hypothetical protein
MSIYTSALALNALPIASAVGGRIRRSSTAMPLRMAAGMNGGQIMKEGKAENDKIMSRMKPGASKSKGRNDNDPFTSKNAQKSWEWLMKRGPLRTARERQVRESLERPQQRFRMIRLVVGW